MAVFLTLTVLGSPAAQAEEALKLCVDEWPPYEYKEGRDIAGICVKTVRAVLNCMGHNSCKLVFGSWGRCLDNIRHGDDHMALTGVKTSEREKYAWFPEEPLTTSHWVFFIRKDRSEKLTFRTLNDLEGHRIGLVKGFHYPPDFLAYARHHAKLEYSRDPATNFHRLLDHRVDFVFENLATGLFILEKAGTQDRIIPLIDVVLAEEPLFVIFSKQNTSKAFVRQFSEELKRFKQTDEYRKLFSPYDPWVTLPRNNKE